MPNMTLQKTPAREQEPNIRNKNFKEVSQGYDEELALNEASRCLNCKNMPCVSGCPVNVRIPEFIAKIAAHDYEGAYAIIKTTNSLPAICGRVCPQENQCESKCVRGIKGEPVGIGRLERFAADYAMAKGSAPAEIPAPNGKKVAVIGSGPAGLTCAGDLAKLGYEVHIFEALHTPGGVLVYGIPEFRLPKALVREEIKNVEALGVKIETNVVVGRSISLDELMEEEGFDAVFVGSGAGLPNFQKIPGENLCGVYSANEFLTRINLMKAYEFPETDTPIRVGKNAAVIGGGNVAMDVARTAKRLGATDVSIVYRRRRDDMTALPDEIGGAIAEGCNLLQLKTPSRIETNKRGEVEALWVKPQIAGKADNSGRPKPMDSSEPEEKIPCDIVISAIGQATDIRFFEEYGIPVFRGNIQAKKSSVIANVKGTYAGGDCVTGPSTVINAIAAGKVAAANIDSYLGFNHEIEVDVDIPLPTPDDNMPCGRTELKERFANQRGNDFDEVEQGMSLEEAMQEASRCLRCDYHGFGSFRGGRNTKW